MAGASKRSRDELIDTINAALEIVDDVAEEGDGDFVRAVVAAFALKELSSGAREDDERAPGEDEEEPEAQQEESEADEADEEPEEEEP
ncbi:MAG TPA: hypothetical protein VFN65_08575, partial [Solirubrobacteraceae bacterium]|nr:hypothetical protein [Solirubrobacteraceae bacterium]